MDNLLQVNQLCYNRGALFNIWMKSGETSLQKTATLRDNILQTFDDNLLSQYRDEIIKNLSRFCSNISSRWEQSNRTMTRFIERNEEWLNGDVNLVSQQQEVPVPSTSRAGRPSVPFEECSRESKRRKTKEIRERSSTSELAFALVTQLRSEGKSDAAKLVSESLETSLTRASKIRRAWTEKKLDPLKLSPEEALSLVIDTKLTKTQYMKIRLQAKAKRANIYPSYHDVRAAKNQCYPGLETITVSDTGAEIKLQALLDHTIKRILLVQKDVINTLNPDDISEEITLICKWGCDGSTGHSEYKQRFAEGKKDTDIFMISMVPLQLFSQKPNASKIIIWQNHRPSSVRFCRPIKFEFIKETTDLSQHEVAYVENQIKSLSPFKTYIGSKMVNIEYNMLLTMIDGKVCNAVTSTQSSQRCYICKATPKEMNQLDKVTEKVIDPNLFRYGLSTLHAWIRFFECLLHISYRLDFKMWQARDENAELLKKRKEVIQKKFREEMGLLVDQVRPGGSGTSNDGNTARRFLKTAAKSSEITGISESLIKRFGVILQAMSSGYEIDTERFKIYTRETAELYVTEYPWYNMPASVHKILIHGPEIINSAILPIGQLSEEAQESRNKDLKMYRRSHTRKTSRTTTNEDLLHCLLVSSDPYISELKKQPCKNSRSLDFEVLQLVKAPEIEIDEGNIIRDMSSSSISENSSSDEEDWRL